MIQDNNDVDTIKFFEGVAECLMNDSDTLKDVKIRAKNLAEQNAQQKISDYIRNFLECRYLTFPDDEILSITNEIFKLSNINYGMKDSGGNEMIIQSTVIAQIDDNDIMNCLVRFFNERTELKSENETLSEEIDDLKCQIESLRKEIGILRAENEELKRQISDLKQQLANNQQNTTQFITKDKIELASQKSNAAYQLFLKNNNSGAILLYDEAIKLNPNDAWSYFNRGMIYEAIGQYYKAIQDFSKAIQLNPNAPKFYLSRGNCYKEMRNMEAAQDDFNKYRKLS